MKQWWSKRKEKNLAKQNAAKWKLEHDEAEFRKKHKERWNSVRASLEQAGFVVISNSWGMKFPSYSRYFVVAPDKTIMLALLNEHLALNLNKL